MVPRGQAGSAQSAIEAARKTAVVDGDLTAAIKQYQAIVDSVRRRPIVRRLHRPCWGWPRRIRSWGMRRRRRSTSRSSGTTATSRQPSARRARTCAQPTIRAHRSLRYAWCARLMRRPPRSAYLRTDKTLAMYGLSLLDLATGKTSRLNPHYSATREELKRTDRYEDAEWPVLTRDSKQVAYEWYVWDGAKWNSQLRVMSTEAGAKPRTLVDNPEFTYFIPIGWANDARSLLTVISKQDETNDLAWVSTAERSRDRRWNRWDGGSTVAPVCYSGRTPHRLLRADYRPGRAKG